MQRKNQALDKVRLFLAQREFAHGGRIPPERTLASELGLGRRSLRRALDILEQEGRIRRHQGRGTFIEPQPAAAVTMTVDGAAAAFPTETARNLVMEGVPNILDFTNPLEVIEVRLALEPVMARLAAIRASQTEIKRLQTLATKTRQASDPETYERADALFHRTIAEAAHNALFRAFFDTVLASLRDAGWRRLGEHGHCFKRQAVYAEFHESIAAAIAARAGNEAYAKMHQHLLEVQQYIQEQAFPRSHSVQ